METVHRNGRYIGGFVFKTQSGIVDLSVEYLLRSMREQVDQLFIVCPDSVLEAEKNKLALVADQIYTVPAGSSDTNMYQLLWKNIQCSNLDLLDGVIFFDDSFFGPLYPLSEMFNAMQKISCDFWSIIEIPEQIDSNWSSIKRQFISGFLTVTAKLFRDDLLTRFFDARAMEEFLVYFEALGYKSAVYIKLEQYVSNDMQNNVDYSKYLTFPLIKEQHCPFLPKVCFEHNIYDLIYTSGEDLLQTMQYIKEFLTYDIDIIWCYLLHTYNIVDIYNRMNINYVVPSSVSYIKGQSLFGKTGIIIHLYYMDLLKEIFSYIRQIPDDIDIIITSLEKNHSIISSYIKQIKRKNVKLLAASNRGRDVAALLVTAKKYLLQYEYLCFIHDKKTSGGIGSVLSGRSFRYMLWENLLKNTMHIDNIRTIFANNSRLGLLSPPIPYHANYFHVMGNSWTIMYDKTQALLNRLGVHVNLHKEKGPIALSTTFWCRTEALRPLFDYPFSYEQFPEEPYPLDGTLGHAIERSLIYVAQSQGYFSGVVESDDYAAMHITDLQKMLVQLSNLSRNKYYFSDFEGLCDGLITNDLPAFCYNWSHIYIYGAGDYGHRVLRVLQNRKINVEGFIVSDGECIPQELEIPCYYLSQIQKENDIGIVVAVNRKYAKTILHALKEGGYCHLFYKFF